MIPCESQDWATEWQEKELDLSVCMALLWGGVRHPAPYKCSAVPVYCQHWPELFLSTSLKVRARLSMRGRRINSSKGSVPGSLTSEMRTKQFLSSQFLWIAQQIIVLPLYFLIYCFPPVSTPFTISLCFAFCSSSLLCFFQDDFFFLIPHPHCYPSRSLCNISGLVVCVIALNLMTPMLVIRVLFTPLSVLLTFRWAASAEEPGVSWVGLYGPGQSSKWKACMASAHNFCGCEITAGFWFYFICHFSLPSLFILSFNPLLKILPSHGLLFSVPFSHSIMNASAFMLSVTGKDVSLTHLHCSLSQLPLKCM